MGMLADCRWPVAQGAIGGERHKEIGRSVNMGIDNEFTNEQRSFAVGTGRHSSEV